ncbi:MAG: Major fimbrial subunit protein (FimA) [Bacteroidetes bacterium]|nr:Major fimbrial subunit protein (FimA) [Bacteroidota bacterium]
MRKKSLLLAAVAAVLMSACSKEADTEVSNKSASVQITVQGTDAASTKATGSLPTSTDEDKITNVTVGLFKTDGTTDAICEGTLTNGRITVTGTEGEREVVVVTNAATKTFAGALTKDEFLKREMALTQTMGILPMSGQGDNTVTLAAGAATTPKLDVKVSRLVARVQLTSLKTGFSATGQYANAGFTLDKVFLYNAMSKSQVGIPSSATTLFTETPVHGWVGPGEGSATSNTDLVNTGLNMSISQYSSYITPNYFYCFQNYFTSGIDNTNKGTATKLVLAGWFTPDTNTPGTKYYVYYPAVINRTQSGTSIAGTDNSGNTVSDISNKGILRNSIYSIEATIKSIGVDSPEKFLEPADLDLGITVSPWSLTITQKIDF